MATFIQRLAAPMGSRLVAFVSRRSRVSSRQWEVCMFIRVFVKQTIVTQRLFEIAPRRVAPLGGRPNGCTLYTDRVSGNRRSIVPLKVVFRFELAHSPSGTT